MSHVKTLTSENFDAEIRASSQPALVDFGADWCGPCRQLAPVVEGLAAKYSGRLKVGYIDVGQSPTLAGQYHVMSVPTLLFFRNGQVVRQLVGARSQVELETTIEDVLQMD